MGKDPTGSRPTPSVATGKSSSKWDTDPHGGTDKSRSSHTKTPTGSRPVPTVPANDPPHAKLPGPLRAAPYEQPAGPGRTKHPTPKMDKDTGRSKPYGGGSY